MFFGLFKKKERKGTPLGTVVHYFGKVKVTVIKVEKGTVSAGDRIRFKGHTTDFEQDVASIEIDHKPVSSVSAGGEAAIKVKRKTRRGDEVSILEKD